MKRLLLTIGVLLLAAPFARADILPPPPPPPPPAITAVRGAFLIAGGVCFAVGGVLTGLWHLRRMKSRAPQFSTEEP